MIQLFDIKIFHGFMIMFSLKVTFFFYLKGIYNTCRKISFKQEFKKNINLIT